MTKKNKFIMKTLYFAFSIMFIINADLMAKEINHNRIKSFFTEQLSFYPQEKIYVQTDRSIYASNDTIWFRVHLTDALLLKQANASRYVYIELINAINDIVQRIKIKPDNTGCFYGYIRVEDSIEGYYTLRSYTRFMQNQGEDYYFTKPIYIIDPMSEYISPQIFFSNENKKTNIEIYFINKKNQVRIIPSNCVIYPDGNTTKDGISLNMLENVYNYSFSKKEICSSRVFLLKTIIDGREYNRYFKIPLDNKTFDVAFFPEGGHPLLSTNVKMGFKSTNSEGLAEEIKGRVFDDQGQEYTTFSSFYLGIGYFRMFYEPGRKYHVICTNKDNISRKFNLPEPLLNSVALNTAWTNDYLRVSLAKSPNYELPSGLQLIAHIRGAVIYVQPWNEAQKNLIFERNFFPAGIVHFLLIDSNANILSERLIFSCQKSTFALTNVNHDKEIYKVRDKVNMTIKITDENNQPLSGNFSISVVDKKDMEVDTTSTIISTLLLSSELREHIDSPMSYLQKNNKKYETALDALMMTQDWRRYDIPRVLKGELTRDLQYPVELSDKVVGKAEGIFSALKEGNISLLAFNDSVLGISFTQTNDKGFFSFEDLEFPEGTRYIIQALTKKKSKKVFLKIAPPKPLPNVTKIPFYPPQKKPPIYDVFISKMNQKYIIENGIQVYNLPEVVVTAKNKAELDTQSPYYSLSSTKILTYKDVEKWKPLSIFDLLRRIPGITISGSEIRYRTGIPMVILDNVPQENFNYERLDVNDINDVFLSPSESSAPIFGERAKAGALIINTKKGFVQKNKMSTNIEIINHIGYQQPVEFYSPIYKTKNPKSKNKPDFRSTIYWNPNVQVDNSGISNLSFYTADCSTQHVITIEGISSQGHLIYYSQPIIQVKE